MRARNAYLEFLLEQFSPLGEITSKSMFGGYCLYCEGTVFALLADNALFLKADDENRQRFVDRGLKAFRPFPDKDVSMSYFEAPPEIFEDSDAMRDWVGESVAAGKRSAKPRRTRSPRARKPKG